MSSEVQRLQHRPHSLPGTSGGWWEARNRRGFRGEQSLHCEST